MNFGHRLLKCHFILNLSGSSECDFDTLLRRSFPIYIHFSCSSRAASEANSHGGRSVDFFMGELTIMSVVITFNFWVLRFCYGRIRIIDTVAFASSDFAVYPYCNLSILVSNVTEIVKCSVVLHKVHFIPFTWCVIEDTSILFPIRYDKVRYFYLLHKYISTQFQDLHFCPISTTNMYNLRFLHMTNLVRKSSFLCLTLPILYFDRPISFFFFFYFFTLSISTIPTKTSTSTHF